MHFADFDILTPGDAPNVLVAKNPAALKAKVGYRTNPLEDGSLAEYTLHPVALTSMTVKALTPFGLSKTGLPTKTEQSDLNMALFGRHGEAPVAVLAAISPTDCFATALDAARIAVRYRTPAILLSDGYLGNGSEP